MHLVSALALAAAAIGCAASPVAGDPDAAPDAASGGDPRLDPDSAPDDLLGEEPSPPRPDRDGGGAGR